MKVQKYFTKVQFNLGILKRIVSDLRQRVTIKAVHMRSFLAEHDTSLNTVYFESKFAEAYKTSSKSVININRMIFESSLSFHDSVCTFSFCVVCVGNCPCHQ